MMTYILTIILIGIIATLAMTLFLKIVTYLKYCNVDMVKAIGSWYTGKESNAALPGTMVHFFFGIVFCFVYLFIFSVLPNPGTDTSIYAIFGGGIGIVHGIVVALALVVLVAEHHPLPKFRKAGIKVAIFHLIAHVIYGISVGTLYIFLLHAKPMILN